MKLDKKTYTELRMQMRQDLIRLHGTNARKWEIIASMRRISRLDMAWAREEYWYDVPALTVLN